jgi:hypothetical protein
MVAGHRRRDRLQVVEEAIVVGAKVVEVAVQVLDVAQRKESVHIEPLHEGGDAVVATPAGVLAGKGVAGDVAYRRDRRIRPPLGERAGGG